MRSARHHFSGELSDVGTKGLGDIANAERIACGLKLHVVSVVRFH
jgi:hypothetical protein